MIALNRSAKMDEKTQNKISQLQVMEQNMHHLAHQRQQIYNQVLEIDSALKEMEGKEDAFMIVGNIMIKKKKVEIEKDLQEKKERLELRIKTIEKQEEQMKQKAEAMQEDVMKTIKK